MKISFCAVAALAAAGMVSTAAQAIVIDGTLDAAYGPPTAEVLFNPAAPISNFGSPTNENHSTSYSIYGAIDGDFLYGYFLATPDEPGESVVGPFVNLYLDTDPDTASGSDLGFEITNDRAFVPGQPGNSDPLGLDFFAAGNVVEFAIPLTFLQDGIASLPGYTDRVPDGGRVRFQLSQAFGYSVAGGASFYGDARLGSFVVPAAAVVPEPASWAMMIGGFGLVGGAMRRGHQQKKAAVTAA